MRHINPKFKKDDNENNLGIIVHLKEKCLLRLIGIYT